jgi:hypothetical protein
MSEIRAFPKTVGFRFQANILCPSYSGNLTAKEEYIIYSVSREEYETCHIVDPRPRVVAECRDKGTPSLVTITFRAFTPSPGAMEFRPGQVAAT